MNAETTTEAPKKKKPTPPSRKPGPPSTSKAPPFTSTIKAVLFTREAAQIVGCGYTNRLQPSDRLRIREQEGRWVDVYNDITDEHTRVPWPHVVGIKRALQK